MARYATVEATKSRTKKRPQRANKVTKNLEGGSAFTLSPEMELVSILTTSLLKDQYYRSADDTASKLTELLGDVDPLFAAKAAVFARDEYGLRSITHLTAAELAHSVKGEEWMKDFIYNVVVRVDDMTEILAAYLAKYGKPVPNALKKGFARAFDKFDEYQLAKYRGSNHAVSLVDVVNLVHPRGNEKNNEALKKLVDGTLRSTGTWESAISQAGQSSNKEGAKAEAWEELVTSGKIGYLALVRNLRNLSGLGSKVQKAAAEILTDEKRIAKARMFPFQYLTAYHYVDARNKTIINALNKAVEISVKNVPSLPGNNLIAVDHSGSMGEGIGSPKFTGDLFGAMLASRTDADLMVFGTDAGYVHEYRYDGAEGILNVAKNVGYVDPPGGHGTDFGRIFERATKPYDRIFIFSDMQSWMGDRLYGRSSETSLVQFKKRFDADPFVYAFDLSGYGTSQFNLNGRYAQIPGISEKIFDLVKIVEEDKEALIKKITQVTF